jgi:hypothetical protein
MPTQRLPMSEHVNNKSSGFINILATAGLKYVYIRLEVT